MKRQIKETQHKPVAVYNFAASLFCTAQSPHFRPRSQVAVPKLLLWHGRLCCRDLVSDWEDTFGTLPVQLQQWRTRDWQDYGCSQDKQNYLCIMAGFELEKSAIGHEMSKKNNANTTQSWIAFEKLVPTYNFAASLFRTAQSLLRTAIDHGRW